MGVNLPTRDFVTTTLNGAMSSGATSATIGTGLSLPAATGILQIDYDSVIAVGLDNGPETITYTSYNSGTGALTGITRGSGTGGVGVAHVNGATVQAGPSYLHFAGLSDVIAANAFTSHSATLTGFSGTPTQANLYMQIGKLVYLFLDISGTSNATGFTLTLPVAAKRTQNYSGFVITDNSSNTAAVGLLSVTASSGTATVSKDNTGSVFTGSGTKRIQGPLIYEAL